MRTILAAMLATTFAIPASAQSTTQRSVETSLLPAVVFDDAQPETWTIAERMKRWNIPGVSVAVIDDGKIIWTAGYGVIAADKPDPVTPRTRFQSASISKPVTATAALQLVQRGKLGLDTDVNLALKRWKLPASAFTKDQPVTLRQLLSHTGGIAGGGFPGYSHGSPMPTLLQLLAGLPPANTPPVVSEARPGEQWSYSGGGYQIVQLLIEDSSGRPFTDFVADHIFRPVGMHDSVYTLPRAGSFAHGHSARGTAVAGGWHDYPEAAAAGLWSTPGDLARFALALAAAYRGEPSPLIDPATARQMMTLVKGDSGLGVRLLGSGDTLAFRHDGVTRVHGWPDHQPRKRATVTLDPAVLSARTGVWVATSEGEQVRFPVRLEGRGLAIELPRGTSTFIATSPTAMTSAENGNTVSFETGADGQPVLKALGMELRKQP
jgi:CubicO group peptidase (beta-lactamase class C family)